MKKEWLEPLIPISFGFIFIICGSYYLPVFFDFMVHFLAIGSALGLAVSFIIATIQASKFGKSYKNGKLSEVFYWGAFSLIGFGVAGVVTKFALTFGYRWLNNGALYFVGASFVVWLVRILQYATYIRGLK